MPGTPTTLTWWDNHVVGSEGTVISSGWPPGSNAFNGTFAVTLDLSGPTFLPYVQFINVNQFWIVARGDRPSIGMQTYIGELYVTPADDAATLAMLRDGFDLTYSQFTGGSQANYDSWGGDFSNVRIQWLGTEVDGIGPSGGDDGGDDGGGGDTSGPRIGTRSLLGVGR